MASDSRELLVEAGKLLEFQSELGLEKLDIDEDFLEFPFVDASQNRRGAPPSGWSGNGEFLSTDSEKKTPVAAQVSSGDLGGMRLTGTLLDQIISEIGPCQRCKLHQRRTHIVFGVGNPNARLMFVGEGPGRDEDLQAEPFVGKAGKLLDRMIGAMGLSRSEVYISNIVKCRPPKNRDPEPDEVAECEPFLRKQIEAIKPEVVVALGRYAAQTLTRDSTAITRMRGQWREYEGISLMPTFHPAYLLRNPEQKKQVWIDLQAVMARLGLEVVKR